MRNSIQTTRDVDEASGDGWQRLHPLTPALRSLQLLYVLALGSFFFVFRESTASSKLGWALIAAFVVTVALNMLSYLRFRYLVTEDSLVITRGILFRERRIIPRSRIENVDLRAGPLQQLLAVTSARIETAGGGGTEAALTVVSRAEGVRLQEALVTPTSPRAEVAFAPSPAEPASAKAVMPSASPAAPSTTIRRVSLLDLVIAGATSNRAGVLVGALFGGDFLFDLPTDRLLGRFLPAELAEPGADIGTLFEAAQHSVDAFLTGLAVLTIVFGLAGWGLSVLASTIRFFGFFLSATGDELRVSYGLFTRREKGFRRSRVQNVQIEEPILRRWLGFASLRVQTAGYGPSMKAEERMETLTPITRGSEIPEYLNAVYPALNWEAVQWRPSHPRARRRMFLRRALVILPASAVLTLIFTPWGVLLLAALLPAWLLAVLHYRHLGHARAGSYVLTREGFWNRRTYIVPIRKVQALHLKQSPFQRRLGLGTVTVETAGNPFDWREAGAIDLGAAYGLALIDELAGDVTSTGLTF